MTHVLPLRTYPDMRAAFAAHTHLLAEFKRVHQRGEKVALFLSHVGDSHAAELRCHYTREHEVEARWFGTEAVK